MGAGSPDSHGCICARSIGFLVYVYYGGRGAVYALRCGFVETASEAL